jgi:hypothetical protein
MKKTSIAVAALLTTLSATVIVPVAYAEANQAQIAACKGACAGEKAACAGEKAPCAGCKGADAGSTCSGS